MFTDMSTIVPEGEKGEARVRHYVIDKKAADFSRVREAATGGRERAVDEGVCTQLFVNGCLVMSDTHMERDSNRGMIRFAQGDVLIAGLGIGVILIPLLSKEEVKSVTVVERSQDVIDLVEPHIRKAVGDNASKLTVVQGDIFEWTPPRGARYHTIYFDIWGDMCTDNLKEMDRLHQKFRRRKLPGGSISSWSRDELLRLKRRGW